MNTLDQEPSRKTVWHFVLRAFYSTVAIAIFVTAVVVVGHRVRFQRDEIISFWRDYWELPPFIFLGLAIWDYWLHRTAKSRAPDERET